MPSSMSSFEAKPDSYMRIAESLLHERGCLLERVIGGHDRPHHLDQRQYRHGVEEVQADQAAGMGRLGAELHDRHRRGVRGEELRVRQRRIELLENLALQILVLYDRLDRRDRKSTRLNSSHV